MSTTETSKTIIFNTIRDSRGNNGDTNHFFNRYLCSWKNRSGNDCTNSTNPPGSQRILRRLEERCATVHLSIVSLQTSLSPTVCASGCLINLDCSVNERDPLISSTVLPYDADKPRSKKGLIFHVMHPCNNVESWNKRNRFKQVKRVVRLATQFFLKAETLLKDFQGEVPCS